MNVIVNINIIINKNIIVDMKKYYKYYLRYKLNILYL
jgi:hypothetical protein